MWIKATGLSSVCAEGIEYVVKGGFVKVPPHAYRLLQSHRGIRPATPDEIAKLEKALDAERQAAEDAARKAAEEQAQKDAAARKAVEEQAKKDAAAAKKAAEKAAKEAAAQEPPKEGAEDGGK